MSDCVIRKLAAVKFKCNDHINISDLLCTKSCELKKSRVSGDSDGDYSLISFVSLTGPKLQENK